MDWDAAIEKNREALKRVLAMLVAMAGLACASSPPLAGIHPTLPRHVLLAVLRLLRPAEAAARRLVIIAARGILIAVSPGRESMQVATLATSPSEGGQERSPARHLSFPLFDPLRRFHLRRPVRRGVPRISFPGLSEPFRIPPPPSADDPVDAARLALRLAALGRVLDDLPREARRFARWRTRRVAQIRQGRDAGRARRVWPLRPGRPPGHRPVNRGPRHEVHDILDIVHGLAFWALESPDTS